MLCCVAGTTTDIGVFAVKIVTGLGMVEAARCWIPVHHLKLSAVVIGVAFDA
jgi:hypothetical protein